MSTIHDFLGFNPHETEAIENFEGQHEPIPNGEYKAVASQAKRKHNKAGDGWFWEMTFTIIEGEYEGRTVVHRFNMENRSEQAVAISRGHMRRFLDCIGNLEPKDEEDLINVVLRITTKCKKQSYQNRKGVQTEGIFNEITRFDPDTSEPPQKPETKTEAPKQAPWKRG